MLAEHRAEQVRIDAELVAAFSKLLNPDALRETTQAGSLPHPPPASGCVEVDPHVAMRWLFIQCPADRALMIDETDATLFQEGEEPFPVGQLLGVTLKRGSIYITRNVLVQKAIVHVR